MRPKKSIFTVYNLSRFDKRSIVSKKTTKIKVWRVRKITQVTRNTKRAKRYKPSIFRKTPLYVTNVNLYSKKLYRLRKRTILRYSKFKLLGTASNFKSYNQIKKRSLRFTVRSCNVVTGYVRQLLNNQASPQSQMRKGGVNWLNFRMGLFLNDTTSLYKYKKLLLRCLSLFSRGKEFKKVLGLHLNFLLKPFLRGKSSVISSFVKNSSPVKNRFNKLRRVYRPTTYASLGHQWRGKRGLLPTSNPLHSYINCFWVTIDNSNLSNPFLKSSHPQDFAYFMNFEFLPAVTTQALLSTTYLTTAHSFLYYQKSLSNFHLIYFLQERVHGKQPSNLILNTTVPSTELAILSNYSSCKGLQITSKHNKFIVREDSLTLKSSASTFYKYVSTLNNSYTAFRDRFLYFQSNHTGRRLKAFKRSYASLALLSNQYNAQLISSRHRYVSGKPKKPNIFSFQTSLSNYMHTLTLFAGKSSPYFYWTGTRVSKTFHISNEVLSCPFVIDHNENLFENSLYIQFKSKALDDNNNLIKVFSTINFFRPISKIYRKRPNLLVSRRKSNLIKRLSTNTYLDSEYSIKWASIRLKRLLVARKAIKQPGTFLYNKIASGYSKSTIRKSFKKRKGLFFLTYKKMRFLAKYTYKNTRKKLLAQHKNKNSPKLKSLKGRTVLEVKMKILDHLISARKLKKRLNNTLSLLKKNKKTMSKYLKKMRLGKWFKNLGTWLPIVTSYLLKIKKRKSWLSNRTLNKVSNKKQFTTRKLKTKLAKTYNNVKRLSNISDILVAFNYLNRNVVSKSTEVSLISKQDSMISSENVQRSRSLTNTGDFVNPVSLLFNLFFLSGSLRNTLVFKYVLFRRSLQLNLSDYNLTNQVISPLIHNLELFYFGSRLNMLTNSNLYSAPSFSFSLRRRLIKLFTFRKFSTTTAIWYYNMLIRFIEFCTGRKVYIKLNPFVEKSLVLVDHVQCRLWEPRISTFQRILGPKLFLKESLRILMLALKYKDPTFLINWIKAMLYRMSFWKYRALFRYIKFVLRNLFEPSFELFGLRGFKLKLKGKISVAGNARTRTLLIRVGQTSHAKFNNKVAHSFTLINSFSGVMGFNIWIFF